MHQPSKPCKDDTFNASSADDIKTKCDVSDTINDKPKSSRILTVQETKKGHRIYYIPHKPVIIKPDETTEGTVWRRNDCENTK